jgi:hypothetical protein
MEYSILGKGMLITVPQTQNTQFYWMYILVPIYTHTRERGGMINKQASLWSIFTYLCSQDRSNKVATYRDYVIKLTEKAQNNISNADMKMEERRHSQSTFEGETTIKFVEHS